MSEQITVTHERTDDIPVILAFLQQMRVAEVIDKHFPTHGHWTGLSLGQMLSVWLTFILSEGDHRLSHVEPWIAAHHQTLIRVYDLHPKTVRVDPTTVSAYVTPDGLFQLGHSKDYRPDLPQLKIAL